MAVHGMVHHCLVVLSNITQLQLAYHSLSPVIIIMCRLLIMMVMHSAVCTRLCNLQISRYSMTRFQPQFQQHSNMQESAGFASRAEGAPQQPLVNNSGLSLQVPSHDDSRRGSMLHSCGQSHGPAAMGSRHSYLLDAAPSSKPAQAACWMSQQTAMPGRRWIAPSALAGPGMLRKAGKPFKA
jgi:hypothetical protein